MGVRRMTGTPWHVERYAREDGDDRRHRSRCRYYRKKDAYCSQYYGKCRGAAHCSHYDETIPEDDEPEATGFKPESISDYEGRRKFPIGSRVKHKSYGMGTVKDISDGRITLEFPEVGEKIFGLDTCVKNGLLSREED